MENRPNSAKFVVPEHPDVYERKELLTDWVQLGSILETMMKTTVASSRFLPERTAAHQNDPFMIPSANVSQ